MSRLDGITKLEQFDTDHWMTIGTKLGGVEGAKSLLQERGEVEVTIIQHLGDLKHGIALPARTEEFDPEAFFKKDGMSTSSDFKKWLLSNAQTITSVPEMPVTYCDFKQAANDAEIQAEVPLDHIFDDVDVFRPYLAGLIDRQPRGKAGDLLSNGDANLFYVRVGSEVLVVDVTWESGDSEWDCAVHRLDGVPWNADDRVFSATTVT